MSIYMTSKGKDWGEARGESPRGQALPQSDKPVGEDFRILHPGTAEEYALARTEKKIAHGYKGFDFYCSPDVTLEDRCDMRRDLSSPMP